MNLLRCHVQGFGKLTNLALEFRAGLNLVFAPNEAGKTTLQRFFMAMLYGQLRPDLKTQRRLETWVENFRPWRGSEYGGAIWCRLIDSRELEIRRIFGREEARVEIFTSSGENITGEYECQRNGEVLFARSHFGLPKELFESVAVIRENLAAELGGRETIRDRIANLAQSGDEELSVRQSLERLEFALESIGSDRAPTRPYKQALDRLAELRSEKTALESRRKEFEGWIDERSRLAAEVARLEEEMRVAQSELVSARLRETAEKVRQLDELEAEVVSLRRDIDSSEGRQEFPAQYLEELNEIVGAVESLGGRLAENRTGLEAAQNRLQTAQAEREEMGTYANLAGSADTDKVTEWFVKYLNTCVHRDSAQRSVSQFREEIIELRRQLDQLGPAFEDPKTDWQHRAMEAAEEERKGSSETLDYAEKINRQKAALLSAQAQSARYRAFGIISIVAVVCVLGAWLGLGTERLPTMIALVLATIFAVAPIPLLQAAASASREKDAKARIIATLQAEQTRLREESQKPRKEIDKAMKATGLSSVEEFLTAAKQAEQWRQRVVDLEVRARESEQERDRFAAECTELYTRLQDLLARAGLSCSPATLKSRVDLFRASLKEFRVRDGGYRDCLQEVESLRAQADLLNREADDKNARIQTILREAAVESVEAFREGCRLRLRLQELLERESSRSRELQRLTGSKGIEQWRQDLKEITLLKEQTAMPATAGETGDAAEGLPFLPYAPDTAEAEQKEKQVGRLLSAAREEHARVAERVGQAFHNFRPISEIEEDLAATETEIEGHERNRRALELAAETVRILSREQQEVLAPQLNLAVEQRFLRLCQKRYREVKIDPDFEVRVRESVSGELRKASNLSRGTQDQLYFALRFGILDLVSNTDEPCPCLLDEPFAAYDKSRMLEAFEILQDEASRRQLVLFTCREDLRELGQAQGAHIVRLDLQS